MGDISNTRCGAKTKQLAMIALLGCSALLAGCQNNASSVALAPAAPLAQLADSPLDYPKPGTVLTWRNLRSGTTIEEHVMDPSGRLFQTTSPKGRSFWFPPDPWADNENTNPSDMDALFPLQVGKSVTFKRHPSGGIASDTVTVVRAETIQIDLGKVDTFVITTESTATNQYWVGRSTVWYAPELHMIVQVQLDDTRDDHRARALISATPASGS